MYLIVGLGNPGPKYAGNRHNVGFMVAERLAARWGAPAFRAKLKGVFTKARFAGEDAVLLCPQTYMNLSGESVQAAMRFFKVPGERLVCIHDELDLPFGTLRVKVGGGTAGHNGLRSIVQHLGDGDFVRLRFGIDRPRSGQVVGYVLSDFDTSERAELPDLLERGCDMVESVVRDGPRAAMNAYH
ncbi:MAG: aminoacyl-tRNA hydrolase [Myxococcales bacterium]|nr:aminoacyl-tRNA hydrolase [Myxococcales bacterium]